MKCIVFAAQKGGGGKSTLAVHLAVMAQQEGPTILVDVDPQRSVTGWGRLRDTNSPEIYTVEAAAAPALVEAARSDGIAYVMVDTAPHAEATVSKVLGGADLVLIPVRPTLFDLQALEATRRMVDAAGVKGVVVLSQMPTPASKTEVTVAEEVAQDLGSMGLAVAPVRVRHRPAYSRALLDGLAVTECRRPGTVHARKEIAALWEWVRSLL